LIPFAASLLPLVHIRRNIFPETRMKAYNKMKIHVLSEKYLDWVQSLLRERWGSPVMISRGTIHHANQLPGFIALDSDQPVGLITYSLNNNECEIVTLDSLEPGKGIASKLIKSVIDFAIGKNFKRVWLITTNDNTNALRLYQKNGFHLVSIHQGAIEKSRKLKPEIPEIGFDDIPIRDEIELEIRLN
jgi:GNAT superfamily N-acetyltransferase